MDNNDVFSMATIFTQLNDDEFKRIFLLSGLLNTTLLEYLNIILLHSLHINTQLSNQDKQQIESRFNQLYKLFIVKEPPNIPYSFIDTLDILNKIIQINKNTYYIFMHLMIENDDETFKNQFIQSLIDNQEPIIFSDKYPLIYNTAKAIYLQSYNQTEEEQIETNIIENDYNKTKLEQFYELNGDYNTIIAQINDIQNTNLPESLTIQDNDFLIKYPYFFKINTPNWIKYFSRYTTIPDFYQNNFRYINYFIRMIADNMNFIPYCSKLLDTYGYNICNLKYLDYYNVTPLMYACGYPIYDLDEYITTPITDNNIDDFSTNNYDIYEGERSRGPIFTVLNKTIVEMIPILLNQMDITTPADGEDHRDRIRPLRKLLNERGIRWNNWYTNSNIDMRYKDAMINLFYLIDDFNYDYDDDYYYTLQIATDMMSYELLELIKYPNINSNIEFKFHYGIDPDSDDKIETIGITYIMNEEETNKRLDQLQIINKDEWTVYKCCLLLLKAQNERDLNMLHLGISDFFNNDNNKYKLICTLYDPEHTSNEYISFIEDNLNFYHDDIDSTDSIIANFASEFSETFIIYNEVNRINYRLDYNDFFNINDNDQEQSDYTDYDDDTLPNATPELIRSEEIIPQDRYNDVQSRQTAGSNPEQLIQYQELALKMLSYGSDACNLTQKNDSGFTAYNYAVKHRLLDVVYQINKLLYTNTSLYDSIKTIDVNNNQEINDYIFGDDININNIDQYFTENTDKVVFKFGDNYTIIHLDQIKSNIIDAKRYTCNETSDVIYRPPDRIIDRINPIFHTEKIGNIPIGGGVLFKDIISIDTNISRFYELEDTNSFYPSFVSSVLVDSAATESAVSMTHCNPGAKGKIYRLVPIKLNIIKGGGLKIKYIKKKSYKRRSSKKKTSKRKSSKSSKRKSIKRK
jgi:hypothetical protein